MRICRRPVYATSMSPSGVASKTAFTIPPKGFAAGEPAYIVVNASPSSQALSRFVSIGIDPRNGTPYDSAIPRGPLPNAVKTVVCASNNETRDVEARKFKSGWEVTNLGEQRDSKGSNL